MPGRVLKFTRYFCLTVYVGFLKKKNQHVS